VILSRDVSPDVERAAEMIQKSNLFMIPNPVTGIDEP
jgi:hypothetical protein